MKTTILTTCAAVALGVLIGRTTVASTPFVEQATTEAKSQLQIVAAIPTTPIVAAAAAASGDFGYGPARTTDW
jgi:hypothetical protein